MHESTANSNYKLESIFCSITNVTHHGHFEQLLGLNFIASRSAFYFQEDGSFEVSDRGRKNYLLVALGIVFTGWYTPRQDTPNFANACGVGIIES